MTEIKKDATVWGIHTQDDALFLRDNVIAIGWVDMGNLAPIKPTREAFKQKFEEVYPKKPKGAVPTEAGMLYRFLYEMKIGDFVIFPSKMDKTVNIGEITGDYKYVDGARYPQQRSVKWLKKFPRTSFTQAALYEIGSAMSLFSVKKNVEEFLGILAGKTKAAVVADEVLEAESAMITVEDTRQNTRDFVLKSLKKLAKGYTLQKVVKHLLDAMGYNAEETNMGGDGGIDVIAYKDELPPRIAVQVKSCDSDIQESTIQSLKGAMRDGDYGLFITLSDYKPNAKKYLDNNPIIRGLNGYELVDLILKYYDKLDSYVKNIVPLEMVFIPNVKPVDDDE